MSENRPFKARDRVKFIPAIGRPEHGTIERTLPKAAIVEFDDTPGRLFKVALANLQHEDEE